MANTDGTKAPARSNANAAGATAAAPDRDAPSRDAVARRAYEIWAEGGCAHGDDQAHWFQAERELRSRRRLR
ncbi:MAG TPA: DUF2934 domain-containing protein [Anaeromyxobacter sp.]|nr:DUF2934 domain-containing protein [Anaeromyxobacter sp.]